jgi:hypothetical protein
MISLVLAVSLAQSKLDAKLDYAPETARMEVICQDLTVRLGVPVKVEKVLQDEVVAIAVNGVTGRVLLEKIALCLDASVLSSGGEFVIGQTADQKKAVELKDLAERKGEIQQRIQSIVQSAKLDKPFGGPEADVLAKKVALNWQSRATDARNWHRAAQGLQADSPIFRFLARVVQNLPIDEIAKIPAGKRTVYSDQANRMQRPIKADLRKAYASLTDEQSRYAAAFAKTGAKQDSNFYSFMAVDTVTPITSPGKVLILVKREPFEEWRIKATLLGTDGKVIAEVGSEPVSEMNELMKPGEPETVEFEADPMSKELITALMGAGQGTPTLSEPLRERILNLDRTDPLGFGLTGAVRGLNANGKLQLVANVSDDAFLVLMLFAGGPKVGKNRLERALAMGGHECETKDGWWIVRQKRPLQSRETQANRKALAGFLREQRAKPSVRLIDLARYVSGQSVASTTVLVEFFLQLGLKNLPNRSGVQDPWLRFLGSLSNAHLTQAQAQKPIAVGDLNDRERAALEHVVYGTESGFTTRSESPQPADEGTPRMERILSEPTELVPNGIAPDQTVRAIVSDEEAAYQDGGSMNGRPAATANDLAWEKIVVERPDLFQGYGSSPSIVGAKFQMCRRASYNFEIWLTKSTGLTSSLTDVYDLSGTPVPFEQLPDAFRKTVETRLGEFREAYKNMKPGAFGGQRKPPPPRN